MKKHHFGKVLKRILFCILSAASLGTFAQNITVSGNVQDSGNIPLIGASILVEGTSEGTQTDLDGNFSLSVPQDARLQVSYIGYVTESIPINSQTVFNIILQEDVQSLDEVVVVGYGTSKKRNITGAVTRVDLEDSPVALTSNTSVLQAIRGATPGVNIGTQNQVGTTPSILVRGTNSLGGTANNNPLIVLDGVIFLGSVADINPSDIATIDILKDASTAVVYGSRAANGVILINTKEGRSDKPVIKLSTSAGFNAWQNKPDLLNREEYLNKYVVQQNFASVEDIVWEEEYRDILQDEGVDTDWIDLISQQGLVQRHNISVSGNTEKINYFISGAYDDQEGVVVGDEFDRLTVRSRIQTEVTDWLDVGLDGSFTSSDFSGQVANVNLAQRIAPIGLPFRYDGQPFNSASNTSTDLERFPTANNVQNPLWGTDGTRDNIDTRNYFRLALNTKVDVPWIEGLSYTFNYATNVQFRSVDVFEFETFHIQLPQAQPYFDRYFDSALQQNLTQTNGSNTRIQQSNYVFDNIINYTKQIGRNSLDVTLVATRDYRRTDTEALTGNNFADLGNTALGANGLSFATTVETGRDIVEQANLGYLARASYDFDGKYTLNAAVRRDASSVFGADRKFGTFWSIGGAWTLTEEAFIGRSDFLNYLKINASYGTNGNQGLSPYGTLSSVQNGLPGNIRYAFGDDPSNSQFGINQSSLGNSQLGWEETTAFNFGIHAALLKNRVAVDIDVYFSQTDDQIFNRQIPSTSGFNSILASLGRIDNRGVEISVNTNNISNRDFKWTSGITFWQNRNTVASLFGDDNDGDGREDDDIANSLFIGESLGAIFGFEYIGVVQESDTEYIDVTGAVPGDPMFADLDGIPGITAEGDRRILGFDRPNFRMGLSNTLSYKNFTFYTLFNGTFGGNGYYLGANPRNNSYQNRFDFNDVDNGDFWTPENQSTTNLRPDFNDARYLGLQSRSFIRLQNVNLSYKLGQGLIDKLPIGLSGLEVYASADNPVVFTGWFGGGDPELGVAAQSGTLPVPSTYLFGVNLTF